MTSAVQPPFYEAGSRRVVDTNIISYVLKGDTRGPLYRPHLNTFQLAISFQTLAELEAWALIARWGERKQAELRAFLAPYVIIHSDQRLCEQYAHVMHASKRDGTNIDTADAWIAATALALKCPLVTHNAADFAGVPNLNIISEQSA